MYLCKNRFNDISLNRGIRIIYDLLFSSFGPQNWWPGDTPFEIIVGAILTQAVNWNNVEKAINNLKEEALLNPPGIYKIEEKKLALLIKPSGYYNMKAKKVKSFVNYLFTKYNGQLEKMFQKPMISLRPELLNIYGIGPETADSILLYAGNYPIFVVDTYTKRIFHRVGYVSKDISYENMQKMFMNNLPQKADIYNEYHALLVKLGKDICIKSKPRCNECPLAAD